MQNEPKNQDDTINLVDEETPSDETPSFDIDRPMDMTDTIEFNVDEETPSDEMPSFDIDRPMDMTDTIEFNVDELVAEVEAEHDDDATHKHEIRRRLDEIAEGQSFEDTYAIEFEKD